MTTAAAQLATLKAMPRAPEPPDRTSQAEVDSALESIAETRHAARMGEFDSDRTRAWLAERCERAWSR